MTFQAQTSGSLEVGEGQAQGRRELRPFMGAPDLIEAGRDVIIWKLLINCDVKKGWR